MQPATLVAIALVRRGDCWLVGERPAGTPLAGYAEFPGGKCQPGESAEEAAVRECREETGLAVVAKCRRREIEHDYPYGRLRLIFVDCKPLNNDEPVAPFRWVPRVELATLRFPDANRDVVRELTGA